MALTSDVKQFLTEWIDAVSRAVDIAAGRLVRAQRIRLVENCKRRQPPTRDDAFQS